MKITVHSSPKSRLIVLGSIVPIGVASGLPVEGIYKGLGFEVSGLGV